MYAIMLLLKRHWCVTSNRNQMTFTVVDVDYSICIMYEYENKQQKINDR